MPKEMETTELPLTNDEVREFAFSLPGLKSILGEVKTARDLRVREIGDGNINFVYVVEGPRKSVVIKQGLSYIRIIGPSWKLTKVSGEILGFFLINWGVGSSPD